MNANETKTGGAAGMTPTQLLAAARDAQERQLRKMLAARKGGAA